MSHVSFRLAYLELTFSYLTVNLALGTVSCHISWPSCLLAVEIFILDNSTVIINKHYVKANIYVYMMEFLDINYNIAEFSKNGFFVNISELCLI